MTVKEFKEYILQHMTADEALEKLLVGPLGQYEKLKFDKGEEVHPLIIMSFAAMDMGWNFCIEKRQDKDEVRGLSVGTKEYLEDLFKKNKIRE